MTALGLTMQDVSIWRRGDGYGRWRRDDNREKPLRALLGRHDYDCAVAIWTESSDLGSNADSFSLSSATS
jgi:hypothetical protein